MGTLQYSKASVLLGLLLCTISKTQAPSTAQPAAGATGSQASESSDIPNVDLKIIPQKSWQNSRAALADLRRKFSVLIRDEISRSAHARARQLNAGRERGSMERLGVFQSSSLSTPGSRASPARFQEVTPSIAPEAASAEQATNDEANSQEVLQGLFSSNKAGAFLDTTQGVSPGQYFEALAEAVEQPKHATGSASLPSNENELEEGTTLVLKEPAPKTEAVFLRSGPLEAHRPQFCRLSAECTSLQREAPRANKRLVSFLKASDGVRIVF